jgi:hypothetical protein
MDLFLLALSNTNLQNDLESIHFNSATFVEETMHALLHHYDIKARIFADSEKPKPQE